jgi:hypothetical protein
MKWVLSEASEKHCCQKNLKLLTNCLCLKKVRMLLIWNIFICLCVRLWLKRWVYVSLNHSFIPKTINLNTGRIFFSKGIFSLKKKNLNKNNGTLARCQWLTSVILTTQEAEIKRIRIRSQHWQIVWEIQSCQKTHYKQSWWSVSGWRPWVQTPVPQNHNNNNYNNNNNNNRVNNYD